MAIQLHKEPLYELLILLLGNGVVVALVATAVTTAYSLCHLCKACTSICRRASQPKSTGQLEMSSWHGRGLVSMPSVGRNSLLPRVLLAKSTDYPFYTTFLPQKPWRRPCANGQSFVCCGRSWSNRGRLEGRVLVKRRTQTKARCA